MKPVLQKLYNIPGSRIALNAYFWMFSITLLLLNFEGSGRVYAYPLHWYNIFRTITIVLLAALLYANNLWLVPRYLVTGKRGWYFLFLFFITYATGLCYAGLFELLGVYFPKMEISDVSVWSAMKVVNPDLARWLVFLNALSWCVSFSLLLFIFTMAWYMRDYKKQKQISEAARKKQVEAELNYLKSQINPHFLFNTLNNLYTLTIKKSDSAPDVVAKLSTILRYLLYESNISKISFEKEKEIMEAYIDLELLRLPNKNNMQFTMLADKACSIPPLLWVPVLENVFKHGTRFISADYFIDYHFNVHDNALSIYSKNSYKAGSLKNNPEKVGGIGLGNLRKRLELLYPGKHSIDISEEDNYFIAHVQIQLS